MRKAPVLGALTLALLLAAAGSASAQINVGPRVGYGTDFDLSVGVKATKSFNKVLFDGTGPLHGALVVDYFLEDCGGVCTFFEVVPSVFVPIQSFYAGAGLDFARFSTDVDTPFGSWGGSSTDVGLALHGGYMTKVGGGTVMADARFSLAGSEQLVLAVSYLFSLGGGGGE